LQIEGAAMDHGAKVDHLLDDLEQAGYYRSRARKLALPRWED
jgi:hypothetical protein